MTPCTASRHGTRTAYHNWGCRCPEAREAERIALKRRREGRAHTGLVASIGTARRLQSLVNAGYTQARIGRELGVSDQRVHQLITPWRTQITETTEALVRELFRRLDGTDGGSRYARTVARKNQWHDAAVWDDIDDPTEQPKLGRRNVSIFDPILVERAVEGSLRIRIDSTHRAAAIALGRHRGLSTRALGERLCVAQRTALREAMRQQLETVG